jgi:MtrB/PioB family decaheme-associated outer membrane protein
MNGSKDNMKGSRNLLLAGAIAAILSPIEAALPAEVDTSGWKCEQCPFQVGSEVSAEIGGANVDDDSAKFGDYTGLDEEGEYLLADIEGRSRAASGWYVSYEGHKLGLDSRDAAITLGKEGIFSARMFYDAIPKRTFDDTATPFEIGPTDDQLFLPAGWVDGGTTQGMTSLNTALQPVDIGHERKSAGIAVDWRLSKAFAAFANFRREDKEGTGYAGVGNFTTALQIPEPLDSTIDSYELGVQWTGKSAFARLSYFVQEYSDELNGLTWDNPYTSFNGATTGRMATAPDNEMEQIVLSAGAHFAYDTSIGFNAIFGTLSQDDELLPFTTNAGVSPGALPRASLNGDADVNHFGLTLATHPLDKIRVRGSASYDERKDNTNSITFANGYVESDMFSFPDSITPERYDYEKLRGEIEGEYRLYDNVRFFIGARGEKLERTEQDVDETTEGTGYSGVRLNGLGGVTMELRIGETHKDVSDTRTPESWENPSFWKYNLANRDRDFGDVKLSYAPIESVTLALDGQIANDSYRKSEYGLQSGSDRRGALNVTWMPKEGLSIYGDFAYQQIKAEQTNAGGTPANEWEATHKDIYRTWGFGARYMGIADKWDLQLDLAKAKSEGEINTITGEFPENESDFESVRFAAYYHVNDALKLGVGVLFEELETSDWALEGVQPATLPTLLALGADPYNYDVRVISFTVSYYFGGAQAE